MDEYIEREAVIRLATDGCIVGNRNYASVVKFIKSIPAADVVEVVRCGECKYYNRRYWENGRCYGTFCDIWNRDHGKSFFCERGKRRDAKHD